ncbi:MAG: hypothetical protein ISR69_11330, partial [Gammaproteobacteria bacterium]|nr:hypothetical protein [Gammaproteobacteria bacterium]
TMVTAVQAGLPPDVLKDKYMIALVSDLKHEDYKGALTNIDKLEALNVPLPESINYYKGEAQFNTGNYSAAIISLETYIQATGNQGQHYKSALKFLVEAEEKLPTASVKNKGKQGVSRSCMSTCETSLVQCKKAVDQFVGSCSHQRVAAKKCWKGFFNGARQCIPKEQTYTDCLNQHARKTIARYSTNDYHFAKSGVKSAGGGELGIDGVKACSENGICSKFLKYCTKDANKEYLACELKCK